MTTVPEIARRSIGGVWKTNVEEEGGPNGGSQPVRVVTMDVAFDTPGLVIPESGPAGIHVADLAAYEGIAFTGPDTYMGILVFDVWDGSNPNLRFCTAAGRGDLPGTLPTPFQMCGGLDLADNELTPGVFGSAINLDYSGMTYVKVPTAVYAYVDDGSGGNPGATQGSGRIMLVITDCS